MFRILKKTRLHVRNGYISGDISTFGCLKKNAVLLKTASEGISMGL